jgi:hypothetical protein
MWCQVSDLTVSSPDSMRRMSFSEACSGVPYLEGKERGGEMGEEMSRGGGWGEMSGKKMKNGSN